jgi:hypothetical protein
VGPRAGLDGMDKRRDSLPGIELGRLTRSPSLYHRLSHHDSHTKHNLTNISTILQ